MNNKKKKRSLPSLSFIITFFFFLNSPDSPEVALKGYVDDKTLILDTGTFWYTDVKYLLWSSFFFFFFPPFMI